MLKHVDLFNILSESSIIITIETLMICLIYTCTMKKDHYKSVQTTEN